VSFGNAKYVTEFSKNYRHFTANPERSWILAGVGQPPAKAINTATDIFNAWAGLPAAGLCIATSALALVAVLPFLPNFLVSAFVYRDSTSYTEGSGLAALFHVPDTVGVNTE
jgi:uncharacterized protein (UPF0261 family)